MVRGSKAGCSVTFRGGRQPHLRLPSLLFPSNLCSYEMEPGLAALQEAPALENFPDFLSSLLHIREMVAS
jgi:hypothetical protein